MLLALREEYMECKYLLDELNDCINIKSSHNNFYFTGLLSDEDQINDLSDRRIELFVEKQYLDILKKIQYLKYDWYGQFLYSAFLVANRKDNGLYKLENSNMETPIDSRKYIPAVEIIDQAKFSEIVDEIFLSDLMQLKEGHFRNNHDTIALNFDHAYISTVLGDTSFIEWNGIDDSFKYTIKRHNCPLLIEDIFSLEMPTDKISPDWLKLLAKHNKICDNELLFDVDVKAQSKKGILQIYDIQRNSNNTVVKLLKK